jgi:hypothetical protein
MRASLERIWDPKGTIGIFVGANPGQADAVTNDATVRKYIGFAQRWGWGGFLAVNLFQWVATDMQELIARVAAGQPCNPPGCDRWFDDVMNGTPICFAWGRTPPKIRAAWEDRVAAYTELTPPTVCAGKNKDGSPVHLSRYPYTAAPIAWSTAT